MREYKVNCPKCTGIISIKIGDNDRRKINGDFFEITCQHCKQASFAKIFGTLVVYPHMLELVEK